MMILLRMGIPHPPTIRPAAICLMTHRRQSPSLMANWCMVAHCSNMQDLSRRTIPRHLQDTALPLHPCYGSPISRFTMPGASFSIPTASLPHICTHTATPHPLPHYARPQDMIPTAPLWIYWHTAVSAQLDVGICGLTWLLQADEAHRTRP
jgi:hypothetical protein